MCSTPRGSKGPSELENDSVTLLILEDEQARWAAGLDDWNAATLLACISEDPVDWSEIAAVWPRYQAGPACAFADALPLRIAGAEAAVKRLEDGDAWIVIDLSQQRIFCSGEYGELQSRGSLGLGPDDGFGPAVRVSIHLPPWWEIHNDAQPADVHRPRVGAVHRPQPRRDVLWGQALTEGIADRMLALYGGSAWETSGASDPRARYPLTVQVHRDWLMTPRSDLLGKCPRDSLHGGMDWIDGVVAGQQWNAATGREPVPIPHNLSGYAAGPMGRAEVCIYFDLCRELIGFGWQWLDKHQALIGSEGPRGVARRLAGALEKVKQAWLDAPYEGGSPPRRIIQDERDRVPHMERSDEEGHVRDCDCPICKMMAEGLLGPAFICFDGHHLELDDEFAFSMWETRDEWEHERIRFGEFASDDSDAGSPEDADELGPVWRNSFVADDLPGDPSGHLGLSFRLADIISELQMRSAPQAEIDALNEEFVQYRHAAPEQLLQATERFKDVLEQAAQRHEFLLSRAADLQSRLDELLRRPERADGTRA